MQGMFPQVPGEDEDNIKVNKHKMFEKVLKDIIHQDLEDCGGVGETEAHDKVFKVAKGSAEHSRPFISFLDPDQMAGISEVIWKK